jgi:hypothetical protein
MKPLPARASLDAPTMLEARNIARADYKKGLARCQPLKLALRSVALGRTRARSAPARRQAAYIFLAFFFAFFAIVSSCASDTSCETPTRKTKLGFMRAATGFCQNANHPKKLNVRSGEY